MKRQIIDALEARWVASLHPSTATERARLAGWFPHMGSVITKLMIDDGDAIAISSPVDH